MREPAVVSLPFTHRTSLRPTGMPSHDVRSESGRESTSAACARASSPFTARKARTSISLFHAIQEHLSQLTNGNLSSGQQLPATKSVKLIHIHTCLLYTSP